MSIPLPKNIRIHNEYGYVFPNERAVRNSMMTKFLHIAESCMDKEVEDLTDEERLALLYCAGVPMKIQSDDQFRAMMKPAREVGIQKINGKFLIAVRVS